MHPQTYPEMNVSSLCKLCNSLLFFGALLAVGFGQTYHYQSAALNPTLSFVHSVSTYTTLTSSSATGGSGGYQISVNPSALTLNFDLLSVSTQAAQIVQTQSFTVGFGAAKTVVTTINIDSLNLSFSNLNGSHSLSPASGGVYNISDTFNLQNGGNWLVGLHLSGGITGSLTGSYTIQGPTQSASGTFTQPILFENNWLQNNSILASTLPSGLDTNGYPDQVSFTNALSFALHLKPQTSNFVSGTVDGVAVQTGIQYFALSVPAAGVTLAAVPEPSTYAAIAGVIALVVGVWKRRGARKG